MIQHRSGHVGVFNTLALERLGVNEETPCPPGGRMERGPDGKLTGYMEENAFLELQKRVPLPDTEDLLAAYDKAQRSYASYGVATVQEGMMPDQLIPLYRQLLERDLLWLDVVGYADADGRGGGRRSPAISGRTAAISSWGYKIFLDGSPQGRTAWMRTIWEADPRTGARSSPTGRCMTGWPWPWTRGCSCWHTATATRRQGSTCPCWSSWSGNGRHIWSGQ